MNVFIIAIIFTLLPFVFSAGAQSFYPNDPYFFYDARYPSYPGQWNILNQAPSTIYYPAGESPSTSGTPKKTDAVTISNIGLDANIVNAWKRGYTGKGIVVGIIDDGVELNHPDLAVRRDLSIGVDATGIVPGQTGGPLSSSDSHGTCVAGMAAATGGNGIGVVGLAPHAEIASIRAKNYTTVDDWYIHASGYYWQAGLGWTSGMDSLALAGLTGINGASSIHIKNSSTKGIVFAYPAGYGDTYSAAARTAANGIPFTVAAGNMRRTRQQDSGTCAEASHPYSITVAALGSDGKYALYSSFGSSVFVTALSQSSYWNLAGIPGDKRYVNGLGVSTTDMFGIYGQNYDGNASSVFLPDIADLDYTSQFDGTSAAAPSVAGMLAVAKQANPNMDGRMAKHLLVRNSRVVDAEDASASSTWTSGGETYSGWQTNASGFRYNPNYGFGLPDTTAMVDSALRTAYVTNETIYTTGVISVAAANRTITASDGTGKTETVTVSVPAALKQNLEAVETYVNMSGGDRSEWQIVLKKGSMASRIWTPANDIPNSSNPLLGDPDPAAGLERLLVSYAFWGEDPDGIWSLNVSNPSGSQSATWDKWGLVLHMGDIVFETPGLTSLASDVYARGLTMNQASSHLSLQSGRSMYLTGDAYINAGILEVNGTLRNGSTVSVSKFDLSLLDVEEDLSYNRGVRINITGGTLSGSGSVIAPAGSDSAGGIFQTGGYIKPGNSVGTLTLGSVGSQTLFSQGSGGTLQAEIASTTSNDLLVINGSADINGILETIWTGGATPAPKTQFGAILTATGGVTGQFSRLLTNITPTVVFKPKYDMANQVYLVVERDYINENLIPYLTPNQRSVGAMLNCVGNDATGDLNTVLTALDSLPSYGYAAYALEQLAPKWFDAGYALGIGTAAFQSGTVSSRLNDLRASKPVLLASSTSDLRGMLPAPERLGFFIKGNAIFAQQKDTPNTTGYDFTNTGITFGSDYRFDNFIPGIMFGVNTGRANTDNTGSKTEMTGYTLGTYATYFHKNFFIDGQLSYGIIDYDNTRRIVFPGIDRTATSSPRGSQLAAYAGTGYDISLNKWTITPTMSFQYAKLTIDSYAESGAGAVNLDVDRQMQESLQSIIGGRLSYTLKKGNTLIIPSMRASYGYEFLRGSQNVTSRLIQTGSPFTLETMSPNRNFINLGAGVSALTSNHLTFYINYDAQAGDSKYVSHSVNAGLRWAL